MSNSIRKFLCKSNFTYAFSFLALFAGLSSPSAAADLLTSIQAAGFKCKTRTEGTLCTLSKVNTASFQYSKPIVISLPPLTEFSRVVLYLHGFRGVCEADGITPEQFVDQFQLPQQISATGKAKTIGVFPLSQGKCETYNNELQPNFSKFFAWLQSVLGIEERKERIDWYLAGHSGAGRPMALIMGNNPAFTRLSLGALLLDATYGMANYIPYWAKAVKLNDSLRIKSVYVGNGSTKSGSNDLRDELGAKFVTSERAQADSHCQVPNKDLSRLLQLLPNW